jgi:hypothetical protein
MIILNSIEPTYGIKKVDESGKVIPWVNSALAMLPPYKAEDFIFSEQVDILLQVKNALNVIDKTDYNNYLMYLKGICNEDTPTNQEQQYVAMRLYSRLHDNNQVGDVHKLNPLQENVASYLHLLVMDTGILPAYMKIADNGKTSSRARFNKRNAKMKELWEVLAKRAVEITPIYPNISTPDKMQHPIDKINKELWSVSEEQFISGNPIMIQEGKNPKTKKEHFSKIILSFDEELFNKYKLSKELTPFDKAIWVAVSSLQLCGLECATIGTIYRYCLGLTDKDKYSKKITPAIREAILKSLRKLATTWASIDLTGTYQQYPDIAEQDGIDKKELKKPQVTHTKEGNLLYIGIDTNAYINGNLVDDLVTFVKLSPLMEVAKAKKQVRTIPITLLQHAGIHRNENTWALPLFAMELVERSRGFKTNNGWEVDKLIELYNFTGHRARFCDNMRKIAEDWEKEGYLKKYKEKVDGRKKVEKMYFYPADNYLSTKD